MVSSIRWGIVGAGRIAHTFAQDMSATKSGVLQAVAARSGGSAEAFGKQYGIPTDMKDMQHSTATRM